ncbi:MAG: hypothetical protein AAFQ82_14445 [Myxococcota bacterium]
MATTMKRQILNYFTHPSFLDFDQKQGVLRTRGGTRLCVVNEDFLRGFVNAVEHETGQATPIILRRCGKFFGERLARRFETELTEFSGVSMRDRAMYEFSALVQDMWLGCGMGEITVQWEMGQHGFLPIVLQGDPMVEIDAGNQTMDDLFAGILEGFIGHFAGGELHCVQTGDERIGSADGTTFVVANQELAKKVEPLVKDKTTHSEIVRQLVN